MRRPPTCARSWIANSPHCLTCTGLAIVLCDLEGLSRKDAAERLGWSEGTLSGRLFRARSLLAARLARLGLAVPAAGLGVVATASAAVPAALAESTIRIGVLVAAGEAVAVAAAPVAALMEGVMKAMLLTKLKGVATVVVISCAVLATSVAGWRANAVGASATLADGQSQPARSAAERDPDKDRIAQLERERDELLKVVRELQARLEKLEGNRKSETVEGEALLLEKLKQRDPGAGKDALKRSILEEVERKQKVEAQRERLEAERARLDAERALRRAPKIVDGGPPADIADKLRRLESQYDPDGISEKRKAAVKELAKLGEHLRAFELMAKDSPIHKKLAGELAEKLKAFELDEQKLGKLKDLTQVDLTEKMKALELDVQKLAKLKDLAQGDLVEKLKAMELDAAKLAKMKALQDGRDFAGKVKEVKGQSGDRVAALEDRVKAMEADLKKLIAELERQRRIK